MLTHWQHSPGIKSVPGFRQAGDLCLQQLGCFSYPFQSKDTWKGRGIILGTQSLKCAIPPASHSQTEAARVGVRASSRLTLGLQSEILLSCLQDKMPQNLEDRFYI